MSAWADLVRFRSTAGGITDWVVSSAIGGCQTPALANTQNGVNYKVYAVSDDLTQWELSTGAYNSGTTTFPRTTVLYNSSGTGTAAGQSGAGTKINFTLAPQVSVVALAEDLISIEVANSFTATQQSQALTNIGGAPYDAEAFNNIFINGGMEVDQANAGAAVTVSLTSYGADGWHVALSGTMALTSQQVADAPPGFSNSIKITVGTAEASLAAGDYAQIYQVIEGYRTSRLQFGTAAALSITLGFWTKIHRTGTYSGVVSNAAGTRAYPFNFTQNVADTWEYKTITIPGDTAGTWVGNTNAGSVTVHFAIAAGTTFTGTAGAWAASNLIGATGTTNGVAATTDVFQITGVTLLPGSITPTAAQSVLLKRSYDQELMLCQRYLIVEIAGYIYGENTSTGSGNNACACSIRFAVPMRANPTITLPTLTTIGINAPTVMDISQNGFAIQGISNSAVGARLFMLWSSGNLKADARL